MGLPSSRRGRFCASRPREIKPARSRIFRCLEMAGWLIANGSASSVTDASPEARRARIARRVGSARAANVASSWSELGLFITFKLYNLMIILKLEPNGLSRPLKSFFLAAKIHMQLIQSCGLVPPRTTYDLGGA